MREVIERRPTYQTDTRCSTVIHAAIRTTISPDRSLEMVCNGEGKRTVYMSCLCMVSQSQMSLTVNALVPTQCFSILIGCLQPAAAVNIL